MGDGIPMYKKKKKYFDYFNASLSIFEDILYQDCYLYGRMKFPGVFQENYSLAV